MLLPFTDRRGRTLALRRAVEDDAEALIAYIQRVDGETPYLSREAGEFVVGVPQQRLLIRTTQARDNAVYLVATHGGAIVGTLDFHGGARARTRHTGEFGMSVRQDYAGAGLGARLLDELLAWARAGGVVKRVRLRVHAGNTRAIGLYRSRGFVEEGRLERELFVDGAYADVVLMARWLE